MAFCRKIGILLKIWEYGRNWQQRLPSLFEIWIYIVLKLLCNGVAYIKLYIFLQWITDVLFPGAVLFENMIWSNTTGWSNFLVCFQWLALNDTFDPSNLLDEWKRLWNWGYGCSTLTNYFLLMSSSCLGLFLPVCITLPGEGSASAQFLLSILCYCLSRLWGYLYRAWDWFSEGWSTMLLVFCLLLI